MPKQALSERFIKGLKPTKHGTRKDYMDSVVPGFGVRVTDTGAKSYVLIKRIPGVANKSRRTIATVGAITLADARHKAREWLGQITEGKDPKVAEQKNRLTAERLKHNAFIQVAEAFISERLEGQRKGKEVAKDLRREFGGLVAGKATGPWKDKQITEIEPADVADIIRGIAKRAPHQARNVLGYIRRLFDWAVATGKIKYSPCASIKPGTLLGPKGSRERTLEDSELQLVWHGVGTMGYPFGPLYQLLILTGLRLNEVADASWPEFDLKNRLWTIPAARMKAELDHVVPLCDCMVALLESLPKWKGGKFLFTTTSGEKAVYVSDKVKKRVDAIVGFTNWVNHDIRRTVRTNLSRLPIEEHVRELMLAHTRKGIAGVYDRYSYLEEKRTGFVLWCARVKTIIKRP